MLATDKLATALVGAEASNSVAAVKYAAPTADEKKVQEAIDAEVGRVHAKLSVMLSHIEGHYEAEVAKLKLKLAAAHPASAFIATAIGVVFGFILGVFLSKHV